jgi:hypothetical protein
MCNNWAGVGATPRPPFRTRHGMAPSDSAPAHVRDRHGKADLLLHLSSFLVDCIGSHLLLQLVFIRRGSFLRGQRRCSGRICCCCCCLGRLDTCASLASSPASSRIGLSRPWSAACQYNCRQTGNSHGNGSCTQPTAKASRRVVDHRTCDPASAHSAVCSDRRTERETQDVSKAGVSYCPRTTGSGDIVYCAV